jgi:hypothetical protein
MLNSTHQCTLGCNGVQDAFQDIDFKLLPPGSVNVTPGALFFAPQFKYGLCGPLDSNCLGRRDFMVPPSGYFRFGSSSSSSPCPDENVPTISTSFVKRKIVRAKCALPCTSLSVQHPSSDNLALTAVVPIPETVPSSEVTFASDVGDVLLTSTTSVLPLESVQLPDSQSASESGTITSPTLWRYSASRQCWEASRCSSDEIEQCQNVCETAYQRALGSHHSGYLPKTEGVCIGPGVSFSAYGFLLGAATEGGEPARLHSLDSHEFVFFLQTARFSSCCIFRMSLESPRMGVHASSPRQRHDSETFSTCILVMWSLTTSLASPLLVGRKLVSATLLITASLDTGGFPSLTVNVKLSPGLHIYCWCACVL